MILSDEKIKFAIVGCGHIGKRHARMVYENEECELVALCDHKSKQKLGIDQYDVPFFQSIDRLLLADLPIDVIAICTPNGLHAVQALKALDAKKQIVIEKPMALSKADCEKIVHKALNVSRQVFCVMQNRYSPAVKWIKEIVEKNILGDIFMVEINCYWNRDDRYYLPDGTKHDWRGIKEKDGGVLFTQFAHFIDIMYWLLGDIKNVQSRFRNFDHAHSTDFDDSGMIHFDFANGGMGCLTVSTAVWDKNFESTITLIGKKGTVKIGGQYMNKVEYCHIPNYEMPKLPESLPPNDYGPFKGSAANHHFVIQNVVDVLKGRKEATTNALEGMKVVEIIERIYDSRRE
ncbi:MAG: Gfo/Idh/MocA family oxidoreductase [Bacteroidetes bacterium]|nr:Gfo/Idh/MocA family oxidoreductase [Bacteroidota bacterium]